MITSAARWSRATIGLLLVGISLATGVVLGHALHCRGGACPVPTVTGNTERTVSPGASVPLDLRLTNPGRRAFVATDVEVTLRAIHAPRSSRGRDCTAADFRIDQAASDLRVTLPAGATTTLGAADVASSSWPRVTMLDRGVNQDGCQGASLRLGYTLTGSRAGR